jgi:hypothetical protein
MLAASSTSAAGGGAGGGAVSVAAPDVISDSAGTAIATTTRLAFLAHVRSNPLARLDFGVQVGVDHFGQEIEVDCSLVYSDSQQSEKPGSAISEASRRHALAAQPVLGADGRPILRLELARGQQPASTDSRGPPFVLRYSGQISLRGTVLETSKQHDERQMRLVVRGRVWATSTRRGLGSGGGGDSSSSNDGGGGGGDGGGGGSGGSGGSNGGSGGDGGGDGISRRASAAGVEQRVVIPAVSNSFQVMRYKLDFDLLESHLPGVWYRDGKGRDNCLTAVILLKGVNRRGRLAPGGGVLEDGGVCPRVPIKFRLLYEDQTPVADQSILKPRRITDGAGSRGNGGSGGVSDDEGGRDGSGGGSARGDAADLLPTATIDASGRCVFAFRVMDVSSKHRKQRFRLRVEADLDAGASHSDVSFRDSVRMWYSRRFERRVRYRCRGRGLRIFMHVPVLLLAVMLPKVSPTNHTRTRTRTIHC